MKPLILTPGFGDNAPTATLYYGQDVRDSLRLLPDASVHTVCTSPPYYGLRDYGHDGQIGLEPTPVDFVDALVEVFRGIKRVLRPDGTLWVNLGDSYNNRSVARPSSHQGGLGFKNDSIQTSWADHTKGGRTRLSLRTEGLKEKDLIGIPWRVAFALQQDGWYLRSAAPWIKGNCMPESVRDRPSTATEYVFLFAHPDSGGRYFYDADAVRISHTFKWVQSRKTYSSTRPDQMRSDRRGDMALRYDGKVMGNPAGRNRRNTDYWNEMLGVSAQELLAAREGYGVVHNAEGDPLAFKVNPKPYRGAHFACWPPDLVRPMILAGCPVGGTVLDPFSGSATTGMVALREGRNYIGVDLNPGYLDLAQARIEGRKAPQKPEPDSEQDVFDLFGGEA